MTRNAASERVSGKELNILTLNAFQGMSKAFAINGIVIQRSIFDDLAKIPVSDRMFRH